MRRSSLKEVNQITNTTMTISAPTLTVEHNSHNNIESSLISVNDDNGEGNVTDDNERGNNIRGRANQILNLVQSIYQSIRSSTQFHEEENEETINYNEEEEKEDNDDDDDDTYSTYSSHDDDYTSG